MYHIEELIRANHLNIEELEKNVISRYSLPQEQMSELRSWYQNLLTQMVQDGIAESGHLESLRELIFKLNDLHIQLLNTIGEERYVELYQWAKDIIAELKQKMKLPEITEMEVCINGLYGYKLLKLKDNDISQETAQAMAVMSQLLGYVTRKYHAK